MLKQICIILLVVVLSISFTHNTTISFTLNTTIISNNVPDIIFEDPPDFTDSQRQFQREMLQAHNNYRACHSAPPLQLDDNLSYSAQHYANRLARTNGNSPYNTNGAGQNLYTKSSSGYLNYVDGREPTATWYNAIKYYDFNQGGFSMETGCFTQVVWVNSQELGVGIAFSDDGLSAYVVARYLPPGNYGNEYQENVFPNQC